MKAFAKYLAGAAGAVALTLSAASPAEAQWQDRRDRGVDAGDIITGVAVVGGIAAIVAALSNDRNRYGNDYRNRYQNDYRTAVNACAYQAELHARGGRVNITDIDRRGNNRYRVRGVIDAAYGYGNYNNNRYDRYASNRYNSRIAFECDARSNGRITDFDIARR